MNRMLKLFAALSMLKRSTYFDDKISNKIIFKSVFS